MRYLNYLLLCALAWSPASVKAHDLWLAREEPGLTLHYGHLGGGHGGEKSLTYSLDKVERVLCLDAAGNSLKPLRSETHPLRLTAPCALSRVIYSSGYWTKTPYGTQNLPRDQVDGPAVRSWRAISGVKRLDAWRSEFATPLGEGLEITPLTDPLVIPRGDKLSLRVTYQGRPVNGAVVRYLGKPRGATDSRGEINIRLKQAGLQLIQTSHKIRLNEVRADEAVHEAALVFDLERE